MYFDAAAFREAGVVGGQARVVGVRAQQRVAGESLRGLDRAQEIPVDGRDDPFRPRRRVDLLEGVSDGESGDHGPMPGAYRVDDTREHRGRCQRAGRIVHEEDVGVRAGGVDARPHGLRTMRPSGHHSGVGDETSGVVDEIGGNHHDDGVGDPGFDDARNAGLENGAAAEVDERLGL